MCESTSWDWEWHEIEIRERIFISTFQIGSTSSLSSIKLCQHTILTHQQFSLAMLQKSFNRILTIISTLFCHCKVNLSNCFCILRYIYGRKSADRTKPEFDVIFIGCFRTLFRWLRVVLWQKLKQFLKIYEWQSVYIPLFGPLLHQWPV